MVKWAIKLGEYDIRIVPGNPTKGQVVADFIVEFTHKDELKQGRENGQGIREEWQLYVDGASNSQGSGAGMVFITPKGAMIERAVTLNNEAEYEALPSELRTAKELRIKRLIVHCDS